MRRSHRRSTTTSAPRSSTAPRSSRIIHLRTQHLGPDDVLLAAKLEFTCDTIPDARRRDRHRRGARASLGADRQTDLLRTRPLRRHAVADAESTDTELDGTEEAPMAEHRGTAVDRFNEAFNRSRRRRGDGRDDRRLRVREHVAAERRNATKVRRRCARRGRSSSPRHPTRTSTAKTSSSPATAASCSGATRGRTTTAPTSSLRGVDVLRVRDGKVAEKFAYVKG